MRQHSSFKLHETLVYALGIYNDYQLYITIQLLWMKSIKVHKSALKSKSIANAWYPTTGNLFHSLIFSGRFIFSLYPPWAGAVKPHGA